MFLSDISRALKRAHSIDFMGISSYGKGTTSMGAVQIIMDLKAPIENRHVLIVEDIIDSGRTLDYMRRNLLSRSPASLTTNSASSWPRSVSTVKGLCASSAPCLRTLTCSRSGS